MRTTVSWHGRAILANGWATFEGRTGDNRPHAHHALQLAVGMDGEVGIRIADDEVRAPGLLIGADVVHVLLPTAGRLRLLFVDRESQAGRRLSAGCRRGFRVLDARTCAILRALWPADDNPDALQPLLSALACPVCPPRAHSDSAALARVRALVDALPHRERLDLPQAALAAEAALSPSRFAHLFRGMTGLPLRPWLRWLRLQRALRLAATGRSLTEAAHAAGFADAAHLTRTVRRHFGIAPSTLVSLLARR